MCIGQGWEIKPMHQTGIGLREVLNQEVGSSETGRGEDVCLHRRLGAGLPPLLLPPGALPSIFYSLAEF